MLWIRPSATSNAYTPTVVPSWTATGPGSPLTVRSIRFTVAGCPARWMRRPAICAPPSTGCSAAVTCPPPSATAVAEGSSRPMRASMSLASHACLKLRASLARSAVGTGDRLGSPNPQARRSGELSTGLRRATHDGSDVGGRVLKDVVEQEGNPLRGCHRLKDDQKCPVVHLATPRRGTEEPVCQVDQRPCPTMRALGCRPHEGGVPPSSERLPSSIVCAALVGVVLIFAMPRAEV